MSRYTVIDHMADVGIKVESESLELLFSEAVNALFFLISEKIPGKLNLNRLKIDKKRIRIRYNRLENALIELLNRIIFLSYTREELFFNPKVRIKNNRVVVWVTVIKDSIGLMEKEIKAATYHDISIKHENDHYSSSIIFDI